MKNNKFKSVFAILLALIFVFSTAVTALAADSSVVYDENRLIVFAPGTEFTETDLFSNFKEVMPGDVLEQTITVENRNTEFDYLKVYLRAVPHDESNAPVANVTAEDSNELLAQLLLKVWNDGELIYEDSPDDPGSLANGVFLGKIAANETIPLKAELTVPLELTSEFADRIGEVDWEFIFEGYNVDVLTVRKIWSGDTEGHPKEIKVDLYKNGEVYDTQVLGEENQWTYTWGDLDQDYEWDVKEQDVPLYFPFYTREGNDILIDNYRRGTPTFDGNEELTVIKVWDKEVKVHPNSVTVVLYNGDVAVQRVELSDANNWSYTWKGLSNEGQWRVIETNIDAEYVPWYSAKGTVVTITNGYKLIQTGQLSWPIPVLSGLGVLLIGYGIYVATKKRKDNRA